MRVVAPEVCEEIAAWAGSGRVAVEARQAVEADVEGAWLVLACTGDAAADADLARWAEARRTFCVAASAAEAGTARIPATAEVAGLKVGVLSAGDADPRRVARVRDGLVHAILSGHADLRPVRDGDPRTAHDSGPRAAGDGDLRAAHDGDPRAAHDGGPRTTRNGDPRAAYDGDLLTTHDDGPRTVRDGDLLAAHDGDLRTVRDGDPRAARDGTDPDTLHPGEVALVGGGTGDPALMTLRARTLLAQADVVVCDRLGPVSVLDELADHVRVIPVGKAKGAAPVSQTRIEQILIEEAQAGNRVVRLKGGDPYLFGRGGEEMLACRAAGVPVRAVPGVTSAVAAAEAAGIPVTHRGTSDRVLVVNGHWPFTDLDLAALRRADVTVVVLMGIDTLDRLVAQALDAGIDPAKPAAVVASATLPGQRTVRAPLAELVAACEAEGIRAPGVIVLGDVAREGFLDPTSPGRAVALPTREQRRAAKSAAPTG